MVPVAQASFVSVGKLKELERKQLFSFFVVFLLEHLTNEMYF